MSKMMVAVFDDEKKAFQASKALLDLHRDGNITAYAGAVVARDADGRVTVKDEADEGPIGTALGMMTGALVGLIAGPEGMVVGAALGSMMGMTADLINLGVGADFVDEVADHLAPGKVALVAEIDEYWTTPVDTKMEELGGTIIRRNRIDVEDEQIERDIAALEDEYQALKAELEETHEENKAKVQAKLDATKAKIEAAGDRAKAKLDSLEKEGEAKIKAVEKQIADAKAETKEKLEQRKAALKADYDKRTGKLKQAWALTKEALA